MESTAQYWKPVWRRLEGQCQLHLAQAHSNRAPRGRKRDFQDAERLVRRFVAGELILGFVPDPEQRMWRTLTRTKHQLTRDRVRLYGQLESLLEDARIKLATCVSDLLGTSSRTILHGLANGETDPGVLAAMAQPELRASPEQLADALSAAPVLGSLHRQILQLFLERLELIEQQIATLKLSIANSLLAHQQAVLRLAAVPGFGLDSAQQVIAEVGGPDKVWDLISTTLPVGYTASKVRWVMKHEPETYAKLRHVLLPHDYLNYWLTGEVVMDAGEASGTGFFDVASRAWSAKMVEAIDPSGILARALPPIALPREPIGTIRKAVAEEFGFPPHTLVACGSGDNVMGAVGTAFHWVIPDPLTLAALILAGLIGGVGQMLLTEALRNAPLGIIAPFDYTQLVWATLLGLVVWGELPHLLTLVGAVIVAGSGVYILQRELRRFRAA